jgi:hypothetical protein
MKILGSEKMNYIIYDLEFNQGQVLTEDTKSSTNPNAHLR